MPIVERDPWRHQYFDGVACPSDVRIPTDDGDAFDWLPAHNWVYDKLRVAETQGLACGTRDTPPSRFPVFAKPRVNLRGMGSRSARIDSPAEFAAFMAHDHMWSELLAGEHVSTDAAVVAGEARWWRHTVGHAAGGGTFNYWHVLGEARPDIERHCGEWLRVHLADYTGMANFETIGGRIIEIHLRFADQWPDLYGGRAWVESLVRLYTDGTWQYTDAGREGFSVVLFGPHGVRYRHPPGEAIRHVLAMAGVSSVQTTFHEDRPMEAHPMPPGGFRLAIVNAWDLAHGVRARECLARAFGLPRAQKNGPPGEALEGVGVRE